MSLPYHIPKPCHEDWNQMHPEEKGRHCDACQKIVVDFTNWETKAIAEYLKQNSGTCGRFTAKQISATPKIEEPVVLPSYDWINAILKSNLSTVKRIAAIIVILFSLSACNDENTTGELAPQATIDSIANQQRIQDSIDNSTILGGISASDSIITPTKPTIKFYAPPTKKECVPAPPEEHLQGDVVYVEPPKVEPIPEPVTMGAPIPENITIDSSNIRVTNAKDSLYKHTK